MNEDWQPTPTPERQDAERRGNMAWLAGAILILIGVIFLFQNIAGLHLGNWWAVFILIPALGSLGTAWRVYQTQGKLTAAVRGPLTGGLVLLLVTVIFLFNLDWGRVWPIFLILVGLGALATALLGD